jgi:hypothetical protein
MCFTFASAQHASSAVIAQRIGDRFRHDGARREMHDGVDVTIAQQCAHFFLLADVADDEFRTHDGIGEAGTQIVENDDIFTRLDQLQHDVAADVAGAAGDQYRSFAFHVLPSQFRRLLRT